MMAKAKTEKTKIALPLWRTDGRKVVGASQLINSMHLQFSGIIKSLESLNSLVRSIVEIAVTL